MNDSHAAHKGQLDANGRRVRPGRQIATANSGADQFMSPSPHGFNIFGSLVQSGNTYLPEQHVGEFSQSAQSATAGSIPGSFSHSNFLQNGFPQTNFSPNDCSHTNISRNQHFHPQQQQDHHQQRNQFQSRQLDPSSEKRNAVGVDSAGEHLPDFHWSNYLCETVFVNNQHGGQDDEDDEKGNRNGASCIPCAPCAPCAPASCSSECDDSCPPDCGDIACCDDDACSSAPDLCLDDGCDAAKEPCTDESCHVQSVAANNTATPNVIRQTRSPAMTESDKAAAAALASFGDGSIQATHGSYLPSSSSNVTQSSGGGALGYMDIPENLSCGNFPMDPMFADLTDYSDPSSAGAALQLAFASHLLQCHDPVQGQTEPRPCAADELGRFGSKCLLPKNGFSGLSDNDAFMSQLQGHECGFHVQDPGDFTHHIFEEHRSALMPHIQQYETPHSHQSFTQTVSQSQGGFPALEYSMNMNMLPGRPFSSASTPTNVSSVRQSVSTTPTSPMGSEQFITDHSSIGKPQSPASLPQIPDAKPRSAFVCLWTTGVGNATCGRSFSNDSDLHAHCKVEHLKPMEKSDGGFSCKWEGCGREKLFNQRSKLERHMQVHTGFKPVQCSICGASLSAKQSLDQHMRIHTGSKPWMCDFPGCGLKFKQQSALTMHERTHTGEKPLQCETCGKRFSESSNLSKHRRIHNIKGLHECSICGRDFHRLDQLRRHIGTKHKEMSNQMDELLANAKTKNQYAARVTKAQRSKNSITSNPDMLEMMSEQLEMMS